MSDIIEWCEQEKADALKSIEFWSKPGREIKAGGPDRILQDITAEHIRDLRKIVHDMDKIIDGERQDQT